MGYKVCKHFEATGVCDLAATGSCSFKECDIWFDEFKKTTNDNRYNPNASKPLENFEPQIDVFVALENVLNYPESLTNEQALNYIMESYKKYKERKQPKPKIIFLDVDGVLNSECDNYDRKLNSDYHLRLLAEIIRQTNARIVVTSARRLNTNLRNFLEKRLKDFGIEVYNYTNQTRMYNGNRGTEINCWLDSHPHDTFVILDDEPKRINIYMDTNFVRISNECGLLQADAEKAIKILNKEI